MTKAKILVVDDEPGIVRIIRTRLEKNEYEVITALNGAEALERVRADKPDLILLDILMPEMDGCEFLQQMKIQGLMNNTPIIVLSAKANMREFFLVEGAVDFIVKPFDSKNLLSEIAHHLQARKGNPSLKAE